MDDNKNLYNLIEKNLQKQKYNSYKKGDLVEAIVEKIDEGYIIVNIDDVYTAIVPSGELEKENKDKLKIGSKIKVFVLKGEDEYGNMIVSQKRTTTSQRWDLLEEAFKNEETVTVNVIEANSGGVIVNVDGVVGFIPTSQLDPNKVYKLEADSSTKNDMQRDLSRKLSELIGTKMKVKVYDMDKTKNKIIFSEKSILSDQTVEQRNETLKNIKIGDVMKAKVTAVTPYGIFVNAEGLEGLVHVSEISWDKVENVSDFVKEGESITVKLIDISDDGKRVAYSIKQLSDDPWVEAASQYKVGSSVKGTIIELANYGIIVKIGDGITGLVHKSEFSDMDKEAIEKELKVGQDIEAVIMTIAPSERKMGLSLRKIGNDKREKKADKPVKKKQPGMLDIAGAFEKAGLKVENEDEQKEEKVKKNTKKTEADKSEPKSTSAKKATKSKKEDQETKTTKAKKEKVASKTKDSEDKKKKTTKIKKEKK